ncbi:hypothetical protein FGIG_09098 [Fasciola gigantica]|uniref:Uncharacterized protein n=1 Tax=Fasciola gigantica TaxID=46835 RepID=A0A504YGC5_FASGI|nr:hypothetical protein FGIG_09098 [Fasciola gigantica]
MLIYMYVVNAFFLFFQPVGWFSQKCQRLTDLVSIQLIIYPLQAHKLSRGTC